VDQAIKVCTNGKEVYFSSHQGDNYRVTFKYEFPMINILHWFVPEGENEMCPTRTGIALCIDQWNKLKDAMAVVQGLLERELERVDIFETAENPQNNSRQVVFVFQMESNCSYTIYSYLFHLGGFRPI